MFRKASQEAAVGRCDPESLRKLAELVDQLGKKLKAQSKGLDYGEYRDAKDLVELLERGVETLRSVDAKLSSSSYRRKFAGCATVGELARFMNSGDLAFAPAVPGNEMPYMEVYRALVKYADGLAAGRKTD
jgi:hypothetical protein